MRPSRMSLAATYCAVLMPMAKQIPCAGRMVAVFTPTTSPREFTSGPPGVAGVQGGVGLQDVGDQPAGARTQRASERADYAGRDRVLKSERAADGDHQLTGFQALGVTE